MARYYHYDTILTWKSDNNHIMGTTNRIYTDTSAAAGLGADMVEAVKFDMNTSGRVTLVKNNVTYKVQLNKRGQAALVQAIKILCRSDDKYWDTFKV